MADFNRQDAVQRVQEAFSDMTHTEYSEVRNDLVESLEAIGVTDVNQRIFKAEREIRNGSRLEWCFRQNKKAFEQVQEGECVRTLKMLLWYFASENAEVTK